MSLILDALNRSRQDVEQVPGLATQHYSDGEDAGSRRRYLPWVGLLAALLIIAWLLLERKSDQPVSPATATPAPGVASAPSTPVPTAAVAPPGPAAQPSPAAAIPQSEPPVAVVTPAPAKPPQSLPSTESADEQANSAVADLYRQGAESSPVAQLDTREGAAATTAPDPAPRKPVAEATKTPEPAGQQAPAVQPAKEEPIDIEKMVLQAREEMENSRLQEHSAPFIADLSQQTKDAIPTIFYERHDYSGDSARSSVVLNGKRVKAGSSAAAGVKVEEILPDSVVLSHRGVQFRLRALNSWVNL